MADQDLVGAARGVVDAFNAADWNRTKELLTEDSVYDEVGTSRCLAGHGEIIPALQGWREGMPDVKGTVESAVSTGNTVVLEVTWRGTHTGPLPGPSGPIAATGKSQ
jgi:predicted ester cyclase